MTSSMREINFIMIKQMILFAFENTCEQLLTNLPCNFKERKVHDQFTQAGKVFLRPENDTCICNEELLWTGFSDWIF